MASLEDPLNMCETIESKDASKWKLAMQKEYDSFMANRMWELAALPKDRKSIRCKWVLRTRKNASKHIMHHKARLVAKRYSQVAEVDFLQTFASIAKFTTIRYILALRAALDLEIH